MCELEKHVIMLRENGGPLSPSRILSHMRSINCQIGDGSQEDAHEFLRPVKKFYFILFIYLYENVFVPILVSLYLILERHFHI